MLSHCANVETGWIASPGGFTGTSWFAPSGGRHSTAAVLIVPGIAHEERTMADGLNALAESLAVAGHGTLLIDLHGTAHSSGQLDTPQIGEHWRGDVRAALHHLRAAGFEQVIVVGVRLGALIALDALRHERVDGFVAWSPVASGRRHVRELRMLQGGATEPMARKGAPLSIAGHNIPAAALAHLATLDLHSLAERAPAPMLLLDHVERLKPDWCETFTDAGHAVDRLASVELDRWLFSPDLMPVLPLADIRSVTAWCEGTVPMAMPSTRRADARPNLLHEIVLTHACGRRVRERTVRIEPQGLSGIVSEPADGCAQGATRLLATLVGPGRLFPELARAEAARGKACLRFDFAGFSTSRRRGDGSGGSLYAPDNRIDVVAARAWLRRSGHEKVVMLGFCAGAWSMIHAGHAPGVVGFVGINVAMYRQPDYAWRDHLRPTGHPLSKVLSLLRRIEPLAPAVDRIERGLRLALSPTRWLLRLCESPARPLLIYGASDLGLAHLKQQLGPRLAALQRDDRLRLETYDGLGHLTEGTGARAQALADIAGFLDELDDGDEPVSRPALMPTARGVRPGLRPFTSETGAGSLSG